MEEEQFYNNIQKAFENLPDNFSILEEQIDIKVQMKYFKRAKKIREKNAFNELYAAKDELFDDDIGLERKKDLLIGVAGVDDVKAFRVIEKYLANPDAGLKDWAIIAYQESKMLMHSSLLDEKQIFISTGLGGKGQKLRYFLVFINKNRKDLLNKTQRKLVKDELIYELQKNDGEFESIDYMEGFSTALIVLPIKADLKLILNRIIEECNQYGDFLNENLIVTNVKILSRGEIIQMLHEGQNPEIQDTDFDELDKE